MTRSSQRIKPPSDPGRFTLLVGFLGRVARRLGVTGLETTACFHLDQGMGGGKSHALVGIWHMIANPDVFLSSELGRAVAAEATAGGHALDLSAVVPVLLIGDSVSPGRTDPRFGPATDLFGRLLWCLFDGHPDRVGRWRHFVDLGANKATLQAAFAEVARPVLVVVDELMDYAMALSDRTAIGSLPGEQAFLNALTEAVGDQPHVALVVVMIRSDEDEKGYHPAAADLREYLTARLQRNGETVTVTEPADFAQIIRRRLFTRTDVDDPARAVARAYVTAAGDVWASQVYRRLGASRGFDRLAERIVDTYPFHPDLFELVSKEWSKVQAFQRVRSTVSIFARTVLHWVSRREAGEYAPDLIGPGDIPLHTDALDSVLSSGVLAGNDRAIQGYRAVASTDIIRSGGGAGTAFALDATLAASGVSVNQPTPAQRMATACFVYSLVPRAWAARGATKAELIAALAGPGVPYSGAEEVFNALVAGPLQGGLGALERSKPAGGKDAERFYLSIKQTLTMFHANAMTMISHDDALARVWVRALQLAQRAEKGPFGAPLPVEQNVGDATAVDVCFADVDGQRNRLVILDPRRWTLLNGRDAATRADLDAVFGISPGLNTDHAASLVVSMVNTQRRARPRERARELLAWERVVAQLDETDDEYAEACDRRNKDRAALDTDIKWAYQHYAYLLRVPAGLAVQYKTMPDGKTSLSGQHVWEELVGAGRAVAAGSLSPLYVDQLIAGGHFDRHLTPKELFTFPYSDPGWPLVASDNDLRQAVFELATGATWMITDSDGAEVRPANAGQIQPASIQQRLRPRPAPEKPVPTIEVGTRDVRLGVRRPTLTPGDPVKNSTQGTSTPLDPVAEEDGADNDHQAPTYEVTRFRMPLSSLSDDKRRESVWGLIRELASLVDPLKADALDVQMVGIEVTINARTGDAFRLAEKAKSIQGVTVTVEEDEF